MKVRVRVPITTPPRRELPDWEDDEAQIVPDDDEPEEELDFDHASDET